MQGTRKTRADPWRVLAPLLVNHLLILVGAYFLVTGSREGPSSWLAFGAALLATGIAIEVAVLGWSVSLARAAAVSALARDVGPSAPGSALARRSCSACGWSGERSPGGLCPRCRRPTFAR